MILRPSLYCTGMLTAALCSPVLAVTRTWDNGGGNANFSTAANWSPDGVPANGDDLVFPAAAPATVNNDLTGRTFGSLTFTAGATLSGNAFTLTGGLTTNTTGARSAVVIDANITLGADQTFTSGGTGALTFGGNVSFGARTLTVAGTRSVTFQGVTGSPTAGSRLVKSGSSLLRLDSAAILTTNQPLTLSTGTLDVDGFLQAPLVMTGGTLTGDGFLGSTLDASGGTIVPDAGDLEATGAVTLRGNVHLRVALLGPSDESSLICGGAVTLQDSAALEVDSTAYTPVRGDGFQVLSKSLTGPLTGTFAGLAEGAEIDAGASIVRISYLGGNGNDVFLTTSSTTHTWTGGATFNDNWTDPENWAGNSAPRFGDVLVFPAGITSTDRGMDNDFPTDTTFRKLVFSGDDFRVRGNRFSLSDGISLKDSPNSSLINIDTDVLLAADQTVEFSPSTLGFQRLEFDTLDKVDTGGHILTLSGNKGGLDAAITGTGSVVIADNSEITLHPRNTFSGGLTVKPGALLVTDIGAVTPNTPFGAGAARVEGGVFIRMDHSFGYRIPNNVVLAGGSEIECVTGGVLGGSLIFDGVVSLEPGQPITFKRNNGTAEFSGLIQGDGDLVVSKDSTQPAEVIFNGPQPNTFSGSLRAQDDVVLILDKSAAGTLAVPCATFTISGENTVAETRQDEQIADSCNVTLQNGASLRIGNVVARTETIGELTLKSDDGNPCQVGCTERSVLKIAGGVTVAPGGTNSSHSIGFLTPLGEDEVVFLGVPCTMEVADVVPGKVDLSLVAAKVSRAGGGTLRKTGPGTMQFRIASIPMEVVEGAVDFIGPAGGSPVTLNGGAVSGDGTCGGITAAAGGGEIKPGFPQSTGVLSTGSLTLSGGVTLHAKVSNATTGTGYDQLSVAGTVNLGGAVLDLQYLAGFNVAVGQSIFPLLNDGTDAIVGTFAGLPQGAFIPVPAANGGNGWVISYTGGTGNDIALTRATTPPPPPAAPKLNTLTFTRGTGNQGTDQVTLGGTATPFATYSLRVSVDLTNWTHLQTVTASNLGILNVTVAQPAGIPKRFYRLFLVE